VSKRLDLITHGWTSCIHTLTAAELIKESKILTLGSPITVLSSHNLTQLLTYTGLYTLPPSRVLSFQVVLIEVPHSPSNHTLLLIFPIFILDLIFTTPYLCTENLKELLPHPSYIQEDTLSQVIYNWYTDRSLFYIKGQEKLAGYAIVSDTKVVEAQAFPTHITNQQAELIALTRAFQLAQGQSLNIFTDSKYAFHILLSHATIWKELTLLTTKGGSVTNANHIIAMLKASYPPTAVGIVHCISHQKDDSIVSNRNNQAYEAARVAALRGLDSSHLPQDILTLQPTSLPSLPDTCQFLSYLHQLFHPNS
jgi:ribonuclease HI